MTTHRHTIVIANFYPAWPPMGGGQRRIFFLARELSKAFNVEIVVPDRSGMSRTLTFSPALKEIRVATEPVFRAGEHAVDDRVKMAADVAYTLHWYKCRLYQSVLAERLRLASACVTAHPYSTYALLDAMKGSHLPFVFDSQNVEQLQKKPVLGDHPDYLEQIIKIEKASIDNSDVTIACSQSDAQGFAALYNAREADIRIIENGVDALGVPLLSARQKLNLKNELNIGDRPVAVFAGSFHYPNFQAAERVVELAKRNPQMVFLVLGSVCKHPSIADCTLANVINLAEVDESTKWMAFNLADIGLNPMETGSGTNVKMFEYAAARLAIVSTPFGARGVPLQAGTEFVSAEIGEFAAAITALANGTSGRMDEMGERARQQILFHSDWSVIGSRYRQVFADLLS